MQKIRYYTIYILRKIKLFFLLYALLIAGRRIFFKKKKINFKKKFSTVGEKHNDIFLGYYDICNFSFDEKKILFHQKPHNEKYVNISIYDMEKKISKKYDISYAWSWQLGCRIKWISDKEFIFNTLDDQNYLVSKSINYENNSEKFYPFSFFSISNNCKYAINLNFNKLEKNRPGYGYLFSQKNFNDNDNYIFIWNIESKKIEHLFDQNFFKNYMNKVFDDFYFNHASWSPNNTDFIIYLIDKFSRKNKILFFKKFENLEIINEIDMISHHEWINNDEIFFYGIIDKVKSFFTFNLITKKFKKINFEFSNDDGHPHSSDGNLFVIDSYPNKFQERLLYTFDLKLNQSSFIGSAYNNFYLTNEKKCDFHPKISKNNKIILLDTSHNIRREFLILEI